MVVRSLVIVRKTRDICNWFVAFCRFLAEGMLDTLRCVSPLAVTVRRSSDESTVFRMKIFCFLGAQDSCNQLERCRFSPESDDNN